MSKKCPHCKEDVEQEDRPFCPHCGYAFDMDVRLAMEMQKVLRENSAQEQKPKKRVNQIQPVIPKWNDNESDDYSRLHRKESNVSTALIVAIGIVCIVIIAAAYLLLHG